MNLCKQCVFILEQIILKKYGKGQLHPLFTVVNFPQYFHTKQLLNLVENTHVAFDHQIEYMKSILNIYNYTEIIVNASPVSSGKSVNTISSCYYQSLKNQQLHEKDRKIILILAPKLVIDEIARGCNAKESINYWYFYDNKLVPSKRSCILLKNNKYWFLDKPNYYKEYITKDKDNDDKPENLEYYIYREYNYYLQEKKFVNNDKVKNLQLPDVIFATLNDENIRNFTCDILFNQFINMIIIDEFLIPTYNDSMIFFFKQLIMFRNLKKLILLSASAPSSEIFFRQEYNDLITNINIQYS